MLVNRKCVGTISVMAGLPSVLTEFTKSLAQMVSFSQQYVCGPDQYIEINFSNHSFHSLARNDLAKSGIGEFNLFLDTDHKFGPDLLMRLLHTMRKCNADVVTGLYLLKSPPFTPTLWKFHPDGTHSVLGDWPRNKIFEVDCAGGGCLLVKNAVFHRIVSEMKQDPFSTSEFPGVTGEDFAFFKRLKKLGIRTICDPRIECHHLQIKPLSARTDYDPENVGVLREVTVKSRVEAKA